MFKTYALAVVGTLLGMGCGPLPVDESAKSSWRLGSAGLEEEQPTAVASSFAAEFSGCVESIGVGLVSTAAAQALIPSEFVVAGAGEPVTPLVVRTAHCDSIAVNGYEPRSGSVVQIGAVIVPPDFTGDINNYTLWYYASDAKLAHHLMALGVNAQHVPTIDYDYVQGSPNSLVVDVSVPGSPTLSVAGTVVEPQNPPGSFVANWWAATSTGSVKMITSVPVISVGSASHTLTTNAADPLGQLIGGSSIGFPILEQFNTYPAATLQVTSN